ncbi:hypothetical protein EOM09_08545 [bacterium]|nr:hypothetical protein [bacterium]
MALYKDLFDIKVEDNIKISISNNEIYTQSLLFLYKKNPGDLLIVTSNLTEATKVFNNIRKYEKNVFLFPEDEYITKKAVATSPEFLFMRLELLNNIKNTKNKIVISHLNSFLKKLPSPSVYEKKKVVLKANEKYGRDELVNKLVSLGYKRETIVNNTSELAVRGYVVDIFPIGEEHPVRIEFFDDLIETIKYFDENTQKTINEEKMIIINSVKDDFLGEATITDYLEDTLVVFQDYENILKNYDLLQEQIQYYGSEDIEYKKLSKDDYANKIYVDLINNYGNYDYIINAVDMKNYNNDYKTFIEDINKNSLTNKTYLYIKNREILKKLIAEGLDIKDLK